MVHKILVASYTNEISTLSFDPDAQTLSRESAVTVGFHPSWIAFYPGDHSVVFTGLEQSGGKVLALKFDDGIGVDGDKEWRSARIVAEASSGGDDPCSLYATKDELFVANYSSGTISIHPISPNPPYLLTSSTVPPTVISLDGVGTGPNKERQERSHPHQVYLAHEGEADQELLVPDLGADKVFRLKKTADGKWSVSGHIQYPAGGGPRHVIQHDDDLFTLLELTSVVTRHKLPPLPSSPSPTTALLPSFVTSLPTLSNPPPLPNDMLAAEILIPATGELYPTPYIYVSNRNDPSPEGDIISIFAFSPSSSTDAEKELELIQEVRTGLKHVRGIVVGGPDDRWLIAGGVNGGGVKVYERVEQGRGLKLVAEKEDVVSPTGFLWV
ncbi:hypothetical protein AX16_009957 [Volvariella volvacea WC 439]|nr:hypothetical protein AX16_009957 [Volvariella volvacea WC 439]